MSRTITKIMAQALAEAKAGAVEVALEVVESRFSDALYEEEANVVEDFAADWGIPEYEVQALLDKVDWTVAATPVRGPITLSAAEIAQAKRDFGDD